MAMLSDLLRRKLIDERGREARLGDLAVDLSAGDYPPVTYLTWRLPGKTQLRASWGAVRGVRSGGRVLRLDDLEGGEPVQEDWLAQAVLLKRDILDALVLDLRDRTALRANDLWLEEDDGGFSLCAVDASLGAVARRLSGGRIARNARRGLHDWKYTEFLRGDPQAARAGRDYHGLIGRLPAGEIANLADALPYLHAAELVTLLPDTKAADTLESMMAERQLQVFEELAPEQARRLLTLMRSDIVADLLGRLEPERARYWLEHMPRAQYDRVLRLLRYPEDTAGGIMTNDMVVLREDLTVGEALALLREQLKRPDFINFIQMVFVVDDEAGRRLRGVMSLRDLLVADDGRKLAEVMDPYIVTLAPLETASSAARRVIDNELTGLPVVGPEGKLLGVVTVDSALVLATAAGWGGREAPRLFS